MAQRSTSTRTTPTGWGASTVFEASSSQERWGEPTTGGPEADLPGMRRWSIRRQYWVVAGAMVAAVALAVGAQVFSLHLSGVAQEERSLQLEVSREALLLSDTAQAALAGDSNAVASLPPLRLRLSRDAHALGVAAGGTLIPGASGWMATVQAVDSAANRVQDATSVAPAWASRASSLKDVNTRLNAFVKAAGANLSTQDLSAQTLHDAQLLSEQGLGAAAEASQMLGASEQLVVQLQAQTGTAPTAQRAAWEQAVSDAQNAHQALLALAGAGHSATLAGVGEALHQLKKAPHTLSAQTQAWDASVVEKNRQALIATMAAAAFAIAALGALALLSTIHARESRLGTRQARNQQRQTEQQISRLLNEIAALASGDLTARATVGGQFTSAIAESVNFAIEQLAQLAGEIKGAAGDMGAASERATRALTELGKLNESQSGYAREANVLALNMARSIELAAAEMEGGETLAQRTQSLSATGLQAVSEAVQGIEAIAESVEETARRVRRLNEGSRQIAEILKLIQDIGEQTSLLALNASMQANKAGVQGSGFRVVAEAVQRLAERASRAANQVGTLIGDAQRDIEGAFEATLRAARHTDRGQESSRRAQEAFERLAQSGEELGQLVQSTHRNITQGGEQAKTLSKAAERLQQSVGDVELAWGQAGGDLSRIGQERERLIDSVSGFKLEPSNPRRK